MAGIVLRGVHKSFGDVEVIRGVDLEIEDREFVSSWAPLDVVSLPCSA